MGAAHWAAVDAFGVIHAVHCVIITMAAESAVSNTVIIRTPKAEFNFFAPLLGNLACSV